MQAMININKEFESTQKVISSIDQSLGRVVEAGRV
jgi:flagellar basal body rod protein FlgG